MGMLANRANHVWALVLCALVGLPSAACKSSGSSGSGGGGGSGGSGSTTTTTGGAFGALTHCSDPMFHCLWPQGLFSCAEYSQADAASYEKICKDGGGKWAAGYCDETGAVGQCLPMNYCMGMGIGFVTDATQEATAQQSCKDTGGTWQAPMPQ